MQSTKTLKRHARLVDDMAQAQGVDLEEQILRGKLTVTELEDAVLRCTGCSNPDTCEHWLAAQSGEATQGPDYCRNGQMFQDLKWG
ncbi:DUF6455 family protein [Tropicibacter naphthalenivorans]|uniref:DUF6455 domain-containing protein n=1 Tax=Tropicibacter naphthalenivorans TaxID=441103 RepID=A0A0P1FZH0_9RHOB|nr:DUF6455 family protein [Tropicibacter naphthalenivorans]CUH74686.1 hypothetical protein TRN7648_00029 [Tropicibacter naphthalenivorans]SMC49840.1 hypothetical protein SAMN04488093_101851 [Tropicibacter naphthalenivorans]